MSPTTANAIFWIAAACCAVAQIALVRSAVKSPMSGTSEGNVAMPRRSGEIAWTIVPAIALALLFAATWQAMHRPVMPDMPGMTAGHRMIDE